MILKAENIKKQYRIGGARRYILDGIDLEIEGGSVVSVTGESGCGKTTLLNVVSGLVKPNTGSVHINGRRMSRIDFLSSGMRNSDIGFIFQTFRLIPDETVLYNVLLPARIKGRSGVAIVRYADELLARLKIYEHRKSQAGVLSGGQKQRVAFARALINRPSLILADEPTANLDNRTSIEIFNILLGLRNEGRAVLVVTHTDYMLKKSDIVYRIREGRLETVQ